MELVKKGFASVNIHPPNLKYSDELVNAQNLAEHAQLGIWNFKEYTPKKFDEINRSNYKGWHRIKGRVNSITQTRKYVSLVFSDSFSIKIHKQTLDLFPNLDNYLDTQLEVRGWIKKRKKRYIMFIRHPSQLIKTDIPDSNTGL